MSTSINVPIDWEDDPLYLSGISLTDAPEDVSHITIIMQVLSRRKMHMTDADHQRAYRKRKKSAHLVVHFQSLLDVGATPLDLFDAMDQVSGFQTDVFAMERNTKCLNFLVPRSANLDSSGAGSA